MKFHHAARALASAAHLHLQGFNDARLRLSRRLHDGLQKKFGAWRERSKNSLQGASERTRRRTKRRLAGALGCVICVLLPSVIFDTMSYRRNLAMARESFPAAPVLSAHDRILVISPHCDDETLGVGGTIAEARSRGLAVRVAFMTNGDGSRSTQIAENVRHLRRESFRQLAAMRQRETVAALQQLGVSRRDIIFLGYPDGGTQAMWQKNWTPDAPYRSPFTGADHSPYANSQTPGAPYCGQSALHDVTRLMREFQPTLVFTTHPGDTHPDHRAAYSYARAALETLRLRRDSVGWARRARLLTFVVHRGIWPAPHGYHPDAPLAPPADLKDSGTLWMQAPLDERSRRAKAAALSRYASQMAFTPHYLRGFLRRNELFGALSADEARDTKTTANGVAPTAFKLAATRKKSGPQQRMPQESARSF